MQHTVKKSRANRIAMRITATIFLLVGILSLWRLATGDNLSGKFLFILLCVTCLYYGGYLMLQTLKAQAYDVTYVFGDQKMTMKMHRKELEVSYSDIRELGFVIPNENLDYGIVQIFIGKEQYTIPFSGNREVGKGLYEMLEMKRTENKGQES